MFLYLRPKTSQEESIGPKLTAKPFIGSLIITTLGQIQTKKLILAHSL